MPKLNVPYLKLETCFKYVADKNLTLAKGTVIPDDWSRKLEKSLEFDEQIKQHWQRHIKSNYKSRRNLLENLQLIYMLIVESRPIKLSDDSITIIKVKLLEGMQNCTGGFHERTQEILAGINIIPSSLSDILVKTRLSLVEQTRTKYTTDIHANSEFINIANNMGYGVPPRANNSSGIINSQTIKNALANLSST